MTGFMEPYDVIFTQKGLTTLSILPIQIQPAKSNGSIRHHLPVGSYMLSVAYDGPEMLELRKNVAETIATIPAGEKGQTRTVFVPRVAVTAVGETFYLVSTPAQSQADPDAKGVLSVYPNVLYDPDGGGTYPDPVEPDPVEPEPEPEPTEVEAPAPSWTDNSDGGGEWTTPTVEGVRYNPASGTATPGQTVTVTATALNGYVLLGATVWTHRFPVAPDPVDPDPVDPDPEPTEVEAPAPSWTNNSVGGGEWTTPTVEGVRYNPASGTATPGQTVTVTATALDGYVLLGATGWTHTFPEAPEPTEVEASAPSWTDNNSDGGGEWTTPTVEGVRYNPASGTATPGQTVTVTATALNGYVLLGTTKWTHTFPEAPEPVEYEEEQPYSFAVRVDAAPVNDRKQIYALTAQQWAALSYLRDQTFSHADRLGALNVALRSDAAAIIGMTSVTDRTLVEYGKSDLDKVRTAWLRNPSSAYDSFVADIGPVIDEISMKGVLI